MKLKVEVIQIEESDFKLQDFGINYSFDHLQISERQKAMLGMDVCLDHYSDLEDFLVYLDRKHDVFGVSYQIARTQEDLASRVRKLQSLICHTHERLWKRYRELTEPHVIG